MKKSKFAVITQLDKDNNIIYSTLTRQYVVYDKEMNINELLENLNKEEYSISEIDLLKKLIKSGIVCKSEQNEIEALKKKTQLYNKKQFMITIFVTNACNFRCIYCTQEHKTKVINEEVLEGIINFIEKNCYIYDEICISWFGGEPLLQYDKICNTMNQLLYCCKESKCKIYGVITSNGYLLDKNRIGNLANNNIKMMQITIDGDETFHNSTRKLCDGSGTYYQIMENVINCLKGGIQIILRINLQEGIEQTIVDTLKKIPAELRHLVKISIGNVFQNQKYISTYNYYKVAIDLGYRYFGRYNSFSGCSVIGKNRLTINTNGDVVICTNCEKEKRLGYLTVSGDLIIEEQERRKKVYEANALENDTCIDCIMLPFCFGDCNYKRMKNNSKCLGNHADGMSLIEKI